MDSKIKSYLLSQAPDRRGLLNYIHSIILQNDKTVVATIEPMMGKEMIIYKGRGLMKYGLASVKNYMTLHVLPIYMSPVLLSKYKSMLPKVKFQKGCINFNTNNELPLNILSQLIYDCSRIDLLKFREEYFKQRKANPSRRK